MKEILITLGAILAGQTKRLLTITRINERHLQNKKFSQNPSVKSDSSESYYLYQLTATREIIAEPKVIIMKEEQYSNYEGAITNIRSKSEPEEIQFERMMPYPLPRAERATGNQACTLCEDVLYYVKEAITNPTTEENVKELLDKVCTKVLFPSPMEGKCEEFVNTYGDRIVAILSQEIDASQVCPMIHACP